MPFELSEDNVKKRKKRVRITAAEYHSIFKNNEEVYNPFYSLGADNSLQITWVEKETPLEDVTESPDNTPKEEKIRKTQPVDRGRLIQAQTAFIWALMTLQKDPNVDQLFDSQKAYIAELSDALAKCDRSKISILIEVAAAQHEYIKALTNALEAHGVLYQY